MGAGASMTGVNEYLHQSSVVEVTEQLQALPPAELAKLAVAVDCNMKTEADGRTSENADCKVQAQIATYPGNTYQDFENTRFSEVLACGDIAVVSSKYFHECVKSGQPFADRANIPDKFFIKGEKLMALWENYGFWFLVVVSYGWLAYDQPDPNMFHLRRLCRVLQEFATYSKDDYGGDIGVILDFCSLWQGEITSAGSQRKRTPEQDASFRRGLKEINSPYGHMNVTAIKLVAVPDTEPRKYDDRGWTFFESCIVDCKEKSDKDIMGELNVLTFDDSFDPVGETETGKGFVKKFAMSKRQPPRTPEDFELALLERGQRAKDKGVDLFTSGRDQPFILDRFCSTFVELANAKQFDFTRMDWGDTEAVQFSKMMLSCQCLEQLWLANNAIGDMGVEALAVALRSCQHLKKLSLFGNAISDAGAEALAAALPNCRSLTHLWLGGFGNVFSDEAREAITEAWKPREVASSRLGLGLHF